MVRLTVFWMVFPVLWISCSSNPVCLQKKEPRERVRWTYYLNHREENHAQALKALEDFQMAAGAVRPMKLVFRDSVRPNKKSVLSFRNMERKQLNSRMFSKEHMKTLE